MAEKIRICFKNTYRIKFKYRRPHDIHKSRHHSVPEELLDKSLLAIVSIFLLPCTICVQRRSLIFVEKISFELMYLDNEVKVLKFLTSFGDDAACLQAKFEGNRSVIGQEVKFASKAQQQLLQLMLPFGVILAILGHKSCDLLQGLIRIFFF